MVLQIKAGHNFISLTGNKKKDFFDYKFVYCVLTWSILEKIEITYLIFCEYFIESIFFN